MKNFKKELRYHGAPIPSLVKLEKLRNTFYHELENCKKPHWWCLITLSYNPILCVIEEQKLKDRIKNNWGEKNYEVTKRNDF